jgi:glycerophosphoryl diester phosphodiesterase
MSRTMKRLAGFLIGTGAAWAFAVKPRLLHKPDLSEIRRYDFARRGFRGSDKDIPENSPEAFRQAIDHGYGIQMDVRLTRDGVPVVFADSRVERMTGGRGSVENSTIEELRELTLGDGLETIPTLEEVLDLVDGQVPVLLDLRVDHNNADALADQVCEVVDTYDGIFAIESTDPRVLVWFRKQRKEYIRGQKVDFTHRSGTGWKSVIWDFVCSSLLLDFLTEPDYISTNIDHRKNPSLWICRMLYRVTRMDWTVKTLEDYELVKTDGSTVVFEDIEP